jgi:hypothetical protein
MKIFSDPAAGWAKEYSDLPINPLMTGTLRFARPAKKTGLTGLS